MHSSSVLALMRANELPAAMLKMRLGAGTCGLATGAAVTWGPRAAEPAGGQRQQPERTGARAWCAPWLVRAVTSTRLESPHLVCAKPRLGCQLSPLPALHCSSSAAAAAGSGAGELGEDGSAIWLGALNMTSDSSWDSISLLPYNSHAEALALQHLKVRSSFLLALQLLQTSLTLTCASCLQSCP